jgi:cytochrome c-type biogenesis protein CcmE
VTEIAQDSARADDSTAPPTPSSRPRRRIRLRIALVGIVFVGAIIFLLVEGLGSSLDYFDTVDQALAQKASLGMSSLRVEGVVVPGSIKATSVGTDFTISQGSQQIPVRNVGSPPGLFQENIPVVVVGHFASGTSDLFLSNAIMVKHSADYIAAHPTRVSAPNGSVR